MPIGPDVNRRWTLRWLVPGSYLCTRLLVQRFTSSEWSMGAEAWAHVLLVPLAQLVVLEVVLWARGRGRV